jgi:hypothetical protein
MSALRCSKRAVVIRLPTSIGSEAEEEDGGERDDPIRSWEMRLEMLRRNWGRRVWGTRKRSAPFS